MPASKEHVCATKWGGGRDFQLVTAIHYTNRKFSKKKTKWKIVIPDLDLSSNEYKNITYYIYICIFFKWIVCFTYISFSFSQCVLDWASGLWRIPCECSESHSNCWFRCQPTQAHHIQYHLWWNQCKCICTYQTNESSCAPMKSAKVHVHLWNQRKCMCTLEII